MPLAILGLGSNLGNRRALLVEATMRLAQTPGVQLRDLSAMRETQAVDSPPDAPPYLNAAATLETTLAPTELLGVLQAIERDLGRQRPVGTTNAPRTIDLDLLGYDDLVLETPTLTLPHPRLHLRPFVLEPLAEVAPEWRHPRLNRTASELLASLDAGLSDD